MKRIFGFLFALVMMCGMMSMNVFAAGGHLRCEEITSEGLRWYVAYHDTAIDHYTVAVTQPDGTTITNQVESNDILNEQYSFNPSLAQSGAYSVTITAYDENGNAGPQQVVNKTFYRMSMSGANQSSGLYLAEYKRVEARVPDGKRFVHWETVGITLDDSTSSVFEFTLSNDVTITAIFEGLPYDVSFDYQDGVTATTTQTVTFDETYGTLPAPTREGYVFMGWYTDAADGTQVMADTVVSTAADHTLYARWAQVLTLTFDPGEGDVTPTTKVVGKGYPVGDLPVPVRTGYTFAGWFEGEDKQVTSDTTFTTDTILTAHWTGNKYKVTMNSNGGVSCADIFVTYGGQYPKLETPVAMPSNGYKFVGWNTHYQGKGDYIVGGDPVTIAGDHMLHAQWAPIKYTVTFDTDETKGTLAEQDKSKEVAYGEPYGTLPIPTAKDGYTFYRWERPAMGAEMNDTPITAATIMDKGGSHSLTAIYLDNTTYTIISGNDQNIKEGGTLEPFVSDADLALFTGVLVDGKTVAAGDYTAEQGSTKITLKNAFVQSLAPGKHTLTIRALNGEASTDFTITQIHFTAALNLNYKGASAPASIGVTQGSPYANLTAPARAGYTFKEWNTKADGTGTAVKNGDSFTCNADQTLYAQWTAKQYTVSFDVNGGKTPAPGKITVTYDKAYGKLPTASHATLYFAGWYTDKDKGTRVYDSTVYTVDGNQALYAHWSKVPLTGDDVSAAQVAGLVGMLTLSLAGLALTMKKRRDNG